MSPTQPITLLAVLLSSMAACIAQSQQPPLKPATKEKPLTDAYGDPLPPGAIQRIGTVRLVHGAAIATAFFSHKGKTITGVDSAGHVRVWDTATGKQRRHFKLEKAHYFSRFLLFFEGWVFTLSPDQKVLAGLGDDETRLDSVIHSVWDGATGKRKATLEGAESLWNRAFTPDSKTLVGLMDDWRIVHWDVSTGKKRTAVKLEKPKEAEESSVPRSALAQLQRFIVSDFSPDTKLVAATRADSQDLHLWDTTTGKLLQTFEKHPKEIENVLFSPDGKLLITGCYDGIVRLWQVKSGELLHAFKKDSVHHFVFTPNSKLLVTQSDDGIRIFDIRTGKRVPRRFVGSDRPMSVEKLVISPSGRILAAVTGHDVTVTALATSRNGRIVGCAGFRNSMDIEDGRLFLWDMDTGKPLGKGCDAPNLFLSNGATYAPDGRSVFLTGKGQSQSDRCFHYDLASGRQIGVFPGRYLALSVDGKRLAAAHQNQLRMYDVATETLMWQLRVKGSIRSAKFSADESKVVFETDTKTYRVADVKSGQLLEHYAALRRLAASNRMPTVFRKDWKTCSPNLMSVAPARFRQNFIRLLDWKTGRVVQRFKTPAPDFYFFVFSPDSRFLLGMRGFSTCSQLLIWDVRTAKKVADFETMGEGAFSPDGGLLYLADHKNIVFWDMAKQRVYRKLPRDGSLSLAFSPDGKLVASFSDTAAKVWELATGKIVKRFEHTRSRFRSTVFAPDSRTLMTVTDSFVLVWDLTGLHLAHRRQSMKLAKGNFARLWRKLASKDPAEAYQALWRLVAAGDQTVTSLRKILSPVKASPKLLARLIADLDSDQFKRRKAALKKLTAMMEAALPALRKAMANHPTLEAHLRMEKLIAQLEDFASSPELLRQYRAVEVLEYIGTKEARRLLRHLATGVPGTMLTREAKATLGRLVKRQR